MGAKRRARPNGDRVLMVVSRYNEAITRRLLRGAAAVAAERGIPDARIDVVWVAGAFELPLLVDRGLATGRYRLAVAMGAVIRGETPHFDYVCDSATRGLVEVSLRNGKPVGFGLLTCDSMEQARARAGGQAGNKGEEACRAAFAADESLRNLPA